MSDLLDKAITIAHKAHANQTDALGQLTISHVLRVMSAGKTETEKIIGALHDLIEDTPWTQDELRAEGFPEDIVSAVDSLSRRTDESYDAYICRVAENPQAVPIKLYDLTDNMDVRRLGWIGKEEIERLRRYLGAWRRLIGQTDQKQIATKEKAYSIVDIRKTHARAYLKWTDKDKERLELLYCQGKSVAELARIFHRQPGGIRAQIQKLQLEEKYK